MGFVDDYLTPKGGTAAIKKYWRMDNPNLQLIPIGGVFSTAPKVGFWGLQSLKSVPKVPLPSIFTVGKVAAGGTILYGGYKTAESIGRYTETGSFTKKDIKTGAVDVPPGLSGLSIPPGSPVVLNLSPEQYPGTGSFFGDIGAGLGRGAGETGKGVGGGLEMALPVLAIGGLAYILLKEKKRKK